MSKVAGKRYTYKFDFNGLIHACQQMTATSAETLAMSSAAASAASAAAAAAAAALPYAHQFGKSILGDTTSTLS